MSLRSATRSVRPVLRSAAARNAAPVGRRLASDSAKKPSGDGAWMMGSAVVFGGLGAYIMMSGNKPHTAQEAHAAIGSKNHPSPEEKGEDEGPKTTEIAVSKPEEGDDSDGQGLTRGLKKNAPAVPGETSTEKKDEGEGGGEDKKDEGKEDKGGDEGEGEARKADDIPEEEIKKAIERGEKTDAPKVAMAEEAAGHQTQAELDKKQ